MVATTGWPDRLLALDDWDSLPADEWHHVECSEGVLVVTPKPLPRHQRAMVRLADSLDRQLPADHVALVDVDDDVSIERYRLDDQRCYVLAGSHSGATSFPAGGISIRVDLDGLVT